MKSLIVLLALALLAGCSNTRVMDTEPVQANSGGLTRTDAAPPVNTKQDLKGQFEEAPLEDSELRIARNGWIRVDCGEEMSASNRLRKSAAKFEAVVMSFNDHSVTFKMPSSRLESLLDVIEGTEGWKIDEFDFSAWDRTGEFYSVEARVASTTAVKDRILKLLESASTVDEVLEIDRKLESIQTQLDGFETSLRDIKLHAGRVDVTVTFD